MQNFNKINDFCSFIICYFDSFDELVSRSYYNNNVSQLDKPIQLTHLTKAISLITNLYLRAAINC